MIIIPRNTRLEMEFNLGTLGVAGYYQIHKYKADQYGNPILASKQLVCDWFPNLITNQGLERMGTNNNYYGSCQVGSGNATPTNSDTALQTYVAGTSTIQSSSLSVTLTPPYYGFAIGTYRFAVGAAAGNLSEIGVGWATSGAFLYSRALILDGGGSPTTITILSDEILDVTYQWRIYAPTVDATGTITISGNSHDYVSRACNVTSVAGGFGGDWGLGFGGGQMAIRPQNSASAYAYAGAIQSVTQEPLGSSAQSTSVVATAYVPSTLYCQGTGTWGITAANIGSYRSFRTRFSGCCFQTEYDPVIAKTTINELQLGWRVAWARATIP